MKSIDIHDIMSRDIEYDETKKPNKRHRLILDAYKRGASPSILALELNLSRQRIYQIINKYKKTL
ncbi:MAG: hypothetical protein ACO3UU_01915 [Minisyncoccia bacterium]